MNEFLKKLAEAIRAKADQDGVYIIKDFFSEESDGEEYVADLTLRVTKYGYITFKEGHWSESPIDRRPFNEVRRVAYLLGL